MFPLTLLAAAKGKQILIELKNGDTYSGVLASCDKFMNVNLTDVILTSSDGERFWKMEECYVRGSSLKYLRIAEEVMNEVPDDAGAGRRRHVKARGGRGRGRSRGGGRTGGR